MGIEVKICGITSVAAADAALRAHADFAGLMFHVGSPRNLAPEQASALAARLRGQTRIVAVLSNPRDEDIALALRTAKPDFLQLHGHETPDRVAAIRTQSTLPVIKVVAVADAADFAAVAAYEKIADILLFDTKAPAGAAREGGHGAAFDWQLLRGRTFSRPWLLAGGLNPDNVARAIQTANAPGVDVSSGVETSPGVKNVELIAAFVQSARSAHTVQA